MVLQAVVLDQGLEADLVADIQKHLENLINAGLRQRLMTLIKVGFGHVSCYLPPNFECRILVCLKFC